VLAGVSNQDGVTDVRDVRNEVFGQFSMAGDAGFLPLKDIGGNGVANFLDMFNVLHLTGGSLPVGNPVPANPSPDSQRQPPIERWPKRGSTVARRPVR